MRLVSKHTARRIWCALCLLFMGATAGLIMLAPYWNGGALVGEIHAVACFVAGFGVTFLLLALTEPGTAFSTQANRYLFAVMGGLAFNGVAAWALWAVGYPLINEMVRRGLMAETYWVGPAILAYAVVVWLFYRGSLAKETLNASAT
jgi:hypothetical protein